MALRNIIEQGDEFLEKKSRAVTKFDERLHILLDDMAETLAANDGLGLAAVQVGILRRVFIAIKDEKVLDFVNPEILEVSGEQQNIEGCLSIPGVYGFTKRSANVKMRAQDRNGEYFEVEGSDLFARELLHENDHLDGILFSSKVIRYLTEEEIAAMNAKSDDEDEDEDEDTGVDSGE